MPVGSLHRVLSQDLKIRKRAENARRAVMLEDAASGESCAAGMVAYLCSNA